MVGLGQVANKTDCYYTSFFEQYYIKFGSLYVCHTYAMRVTTYMYVSQCVYEYVCHNYIHVLLSDYQVSAALLL